MVKQAVTERRDSIRAKRILSIQYRLAKSKLKSEKIWHLSTTADMSASGLSFLSEIPFQLKDVLEIHVVMSGVLDIVKGFAEVVRVERKVSAAYYLIAVQFVNYKLPKTVKPVNRVTKILKAKKHSKRTK